MVSIVMLLHVLIIICKFSFEFKTLITQNMLSNERVKAKFEGQAFNDAQQQLRDMRAS